MTEIRAVGRFHFDEAHLSKIKELVDACIAIAKEKDGGTLSYDWYLGGACTEIVVQERFVDSASLLAHAGNVAGCMAQLQALATVSIEIFGTPSDDLRTLADSMGIKVFEFHAGL